MKEYYFLFAVALFLTLFAAVQDLKKREVSNWLNFSFITIALAYRAFFSVLSQDYKFFILGLIGFLLFFLLAHIFYYTQTFAGGDAKLLMGFGVILPYANYKDILITSITFLFLLFLFGAFYSIIYSVFVIKKNKQKFKKEFLALFKKYKTPQTIFIAVLAGSVILSFFNILFIFLVILSLIPIAYLYTKSLERCMIALLAPAELTEGDWLVRDVKLNSMVIKKSVHGLTKKEISYLKKHNKKVLIKSGIPFVPAFLITLIFMVFFFLVYKLPLQEIFYFLSL